MGTEALWIPAVMAVLGAGVSTYNTQKTAKKQDQALAASIERKAEKGRVADKRTGELIDQLETSNPLDERGQALAQYTQALRAGEGAATGGVTRGAGAASSRYAEDAAAAALGIEGYGANRAANQSVIDAASLQRFNEGKNFSAAGSDINEIARQARMAEFLGGLQVARVGRNPWLDAAATGLTAAGGAYGSGTGGGAATSSGAGTTAEWAPWVNATNTGTAFGTGRR